MQISGGIMATLCADYGEISIGLHFLTKYSLYHTHSIVFMICRNTTEQ